MQKRIQTTAFGTQRKVRCASDSDTQNVGMMHWRGVGVTCGGVGSYREVCYRQYQMVLKRKDERFARDTTEIGRHRY